MMNVHLLRRLTMLLPIVFAGLLTACADTPARRVAPAPAKKPIKNLTQPPQDDFSEGKSISGAHWKWLTSVQSQEKTRHAPHSENYLLEFKTDGWFNIEAPCFKGDGMYEVDNDRIAFALVHSSQARKCPSNANLTFFLKTLEASSGYREDSERLSLYDKRGKTTLIFLRQGD